jgi:hypothetical protein
MSEKRHLLIIKEILKRTVKTNDCWLYKGNLDKDGYGCLWYNKYVKIRVHRFVYQFVKKKKLSSSVFVLHKCDIPNCIRPSHLFEGTHLDNVRDMMQKGRAIKAKGQTHYKAKLCETDIIEIRKLWPNKTQLQIAEIYKVAESTIQAILNKRNWKHI